jgi:hypothetical protein
MISPHPLAALRTSLLIALACATALPAASPAPATGSLTGRVINMVTGHYLTNARVAVRGTDLVAFTDQTGTYRLTRVPAGPAVLEVFYTGLDPQRIPVEVPAGGRLERNVDLTSLARYGQVSDLVKLDSFIVISSRETDGEAIAVNEQRFAPNIKNIVAADALGPISKPSTSPPVPASTTATRLACGPTGASTATACSRSTARSAALCRIDPRRTSTSAPAPTARPRPPPAYP